MTTQLQRTTDEKSIEFIPFGSSDRIKLSVTIIQNLCAVHTKSGRTCSQRDALRFLMLCQAQRLNPFAGDAYLVGYDSKDAQGNIVPTFSLITAHQALLKRAEASNDYEGMESGVILMDEAGKISEREGDFHTPEEKVVGGWARVFRKGRKPTYKRIAMEQRKPKYESQFWTGHKASEQIVKTAEADALRSTFPTLLGGLYTGEEMDQRADKFVAEISADRRSDFEAGGLVETVSRASIPAPQAPGKEQEADEDDGGLGPQKPATQPQPQRAEEASNIAELKKLVRDNGFTFDQLRKWGDESGVIENADSLGSFDEIPNDTARRLLRAKVGLLKSLATIKGGAK